MRVRILRAVSALSCVLLIGFEVTVAAEPVPTVSFGWQSNYDSAYRLAQQQKKMLLIYFQQSAVARTVANQPQAAPESASDANDQVLMAIGAMAANAEGRSRLVRFVLVRLPLDTMEEVDDKPMTLLDHPAFAELHRGPGIAILDFKHVDQPYYKEAVSFCPLTSGKYYQFRPEHLAVLMDLPPGTCHPADDGVRGPHSSGEAGEHVGRGQSGAVRRGGQPFAISGPDSGAGAPTMGKPLPSNRLSIIWPRYARHTVRSGRRKLAERESRRFLRRLRRQLASVVGALVRGSGSACQLRL